MTVPALFSGELRFLDSGGHTDVQTVIDAIALEITSLLEPWTLISADTYESPVPAATASADQRKMRLTITRVSISRIQWHGKDENGLTVFDGTFDMALTPGTVRISCGPHHLCAEIEANGGVKEMAYMSLLDASPFPLDSIGAVVACTAHRNAGGSAIQLDFDEVRIQDVAPDGDGRIMGFNCTITGGCTGFTTSGSFIVLPAEVRVEAVAGNHRNGGKLSQFIVVPNTLTPGDTITAPIGGGGAGQFFILGRDQGASTDGGRLAVRRA